MCVGRAVRATPQLARERRDPGGTEGKGAGDGRCGVKVCRKGVATKDRVSKVSSMCSGNSVCIGEVVEVVKSKRWSPRARMWAGVATFIYWLQGNVC